jgi:hypothetical protein
VALLGIVVGMLGEDDGARGVRGERLLRLLLIAGAVVVLMAAACVPAAMVSPGSRPPDRALLFPNTALVFAITYFGLLVGRALRSKARGHMVTAALVTSAFLLMTSTLAAFGAAAGTMWQARSAAREFAATWDREDRYISQQAHSGNADVVVSPIYTDFAIAFPTYGFSQMNFAAADELSVYPTHWVNQSVAAYYGIRSIRSSNDLGDPSRRLNEPLTLPTR